MVFTVIGENMKDIIAAILEGMERQRQPSKDSAYVFDKYSGEWRYILDGKDYSSLNALHYLTDCGFSGHDAILYLNELKKEAGGK